MREAVARTLSDLGLDPIILAEQANRGRTLIEKLERSSAVGFAVVLLSPDDMGYSVKKGPKSAEPRARQNVILELGYFVGLLGRDCVCTLKRGSDLEFPSDFLNVGYTAFDDAGQWKLELVRELQAAGYEVDANSLIKGAAV
jgi:predicted nucleotide-binding protein